MMLDDAKNKPAEEAPLLVPVAIIDPRWRVGQLMGNVVVEVNHPGFGALHFLLPNAAAKDLSRILRESAEHNEFPVTPGRAQ